MAFKTPQVKFIQRKTCMYFISHGESPGRFLLKHPAPVTKSCVEQSSPTHAVQAPLHTGMLPFPTQQHKETFEYTWSRWLCLFFLFHLILTHAGTTLTSCLLVAAILSSQIQKSHIVCTQTSHYSLLSQSYKMSKNLIYLPLKHIIIIFPVQFLPFSPLVLIASQLP